jgi:polygalacturonase
MFKFLIILLFPSIAFAANVTDYGAVCDGVTDDTVAIQAAVNATGPGVLELPTGACAISSTIHITSGMTLKGQGRQSSFIQMTSPTMNGFAVDSDNGVSFLDLAIFAPDATSGAMITFSGVTRANALSRFVNCSFIKGYNQIVTTAAYIWIADGNYHYGYKNSAFIVQNTNDVDDGDSTISNSTFSGGDSNSVTIIQYSSGGLRVVNNKLLGGAGAYKLNLAAGAITSDLIFVGNSVENQTAFALQFSSAGGGTFANIVINSNQFMNQPIVVAMNSNTRFMSRIVINDNSMSVVAQYGIILTNVEDFVVSDNQISGINGAVSGIAIGANSQNGKIGGNRTKAFTYGISNSSSSTTVTN